MKSCSLSCSYAAFAISVSFSARGSLVTSLSGFSTSFLTFAAHCVVIKEFVIPLFDTCKALGRFHTVDRTTIHSLMSGKYAQNREIGSRTVVLFNISPDSFVRHFSSLPIWSIQRLDSLRIQVLYCLLVASANSILWRRHRRRKHQWSPRSAFERQSLLCLISRDPTVLIHLTTNLVTSPSIPLPLSVIASRLPHSPVPSMLLSENLHRPICSVILPLLNLIVSVVCLLDVTWQSQRYAI